MVWVQIAIAIVMMIVGELLRPKPKLSNAKPSALGDFNFPTSDASRVIPFFCGLCKFRGMNTVWYGGLRVVAITKKVKTGWFSSQRVTQGHKYFLGVQMIAGYGPVDELNSFQIDDKPVQMRSLVDHGDYWQFQIDEPTLLETLEPASGVVGTIRIYKGNRTQTQDPYLSQQWGEAAIPAYRSLCYMVLVDMYVGNNETPPIFTPILGCRQNVLGLTGGKHIVNGDANIANEAYRVMTNTMYGMKIEETRIDKQSFIDNAYTLFDENCGISMQFDTSRPGRDWLEEILRHADATVFADPMTGLYTMKMARDDYDVEDLDIFDDDNIDEESFEFARVSWDQTKNTIIINYTSRENDFRVRPVQYQDLANIMARGNVIDSEQVDFLGYSNALAATTAAARIGRAMSSPLARCSFKTNRSGYALRPGSVILVSKPNRGLESLVARVVDISYGTLDDPAVTVVCTEDIFAVRALSYVIPAPSDWVPPVGEPLPLAAQKLMEAPRFNAPDDSRYVLTLGARAGGSDLGYEIHTDPLGGVAYAKTGATDDFTPTALLNAAYLRTGADVDDVGFQIKTGLNLEVLETVTAAERDQGYNLLLIGNEIIAWREIVNNGAGIYTIRGNYRGALDTIAQDHAINDRVWFFGDGAGLTKEDGYAADSALSAKLLTRTPRKTLPLASATALNITMTSRALRPFSPGKLRIGSLRPDLIVTAPAGSFVMSWEHRSRLDAAVKSQASTDGSIERTATYTLRFYNAADTLLVEKAGITGKSASVQLAFTGNVRVELWAVRDGLASFQKQSYVFPYDAAGGVVNQITADETIYVMDGGAP